MRNVFTILLLLLITVSSFSQSTNWPTWRGPSMNGVAPAGNPPVEWSETNNLKWKVDIPGKGHSTPIIWNDIIYVTTAAESDREQAESQIRGSDTGSNTTRSVHQFMIIAYDKETGAEVWRSVLAEETPVEGTHVDGSWASNSPVTNGTNLFVYFGSRGLFCLDMRGNLKWSRDFGQLDKKMSFGEGSSPALYKDRIAILWDDERDSKIILLNADTGEDVWVKERDEPTTWTSPIIVDHNGKPQIIAGGTKKIMSYDLITGNVVWQSSGLTENVIPQPIHQDGIIYTLSGYRGNSVMAIDLSKASGDITGSDAILWKLNRNAPYVPSPALYENRLYFLWGNNGKLSNVDVNDGTVIYENMDVPGMGSAYPSPTIAGGNIYFMGSTGTGNVVKAGDSFELISTNKLDDKFSASPIVSGNSLYLRGFNNLYRIAAD